MDKATRKFLSNSFYWEEIFLCNDGMSICLVITEDQNFKVIIPPCRLYPNGWQFIFSTLQAAYAFIAFIRSQVSLMIYLDELLAFQEEMKNQELLRFAEKQLSDFIEMLNEQRRVFNEQFPLQQHTSSPGPRMG